MGSNAINCISSYWNTLYRSFVPLRPGNIDLFCVSPWHTSCLKVMIHKSVSHAILLHLIDVTVSMIGWNRSRVLETKHRVALRRSYILHVREYQNVDDVTKMARHFPTSPDSLECYIRSVILEGYLFGILNNALPYL